MADVIFYMSFSLDDEDEDENSVVKNLGFIVRDAIFVGEFNQHAEDLYDQVTEPLESEYGVHDWSSRPVDGINAIGYCTYEVGELSILELMEKWRIALGTYLHSTSIGPVVELTAEQTDNDQSVYDALNTYQA
jgi:hypothetical protein